MQRWAWRCLPMLGAAISIAHAAFAGVRPAADSTDIVRLTDADAGVRALARNHLSDSTEKFAQTLAEGVRSDDPELRQQSALLLLQRQWTVPADDDMVHQLLGNYSTLDADARCDQIDLLMGLPHDAGRAAIVRILRYDPCAAVRWAAMTALRQQHPASTSAAVAFANELLGKSASAPVDNVSLMALVGWTLRETDPVRAEQTMRDVVDAEAKLPTAVRGQLDVVFLWLIDRAIANGQTPRALALLRQQSRQQLWDPRQLPESVGALFSLHAVHGPFNGLADDVNLASGYWYRPELMYCVAQWFDRVQMNGLSGGLGILSMIAGGFTPESHEAVGTFLVQQGWVDPAEREFTAALWLSGGRAVNAWFDLSRVAAMRDDDFGVATYLQEGLTRAAGQELQRRTRFGDSTPWLDRDAWADVHFHFLRAAMRANDPAAIEVHLKKLMELDKLNDILTGDPGLAADIVPALRTLGRAAEADRCFAAAFKTLRDGVTAAPNDAEMLNNLAWLCARSGEHLGEAEGWSDRAVAAAPATAAYLDTAAEVRFRNGKAAEAAELEAKAISLSPQDTFMQHQLVKYRAAAAPR